MMQQFNYGLAITCAPHVITCSLITPAKGRLMLKAYSRIPLTNLELERGIIFNPSRIQTIIQSFITRHKAHMMPIHYALSKPLVHEEFFLLPTAHPSLNHFPVTHGPHWHWDYQYLYPTDNGHQFYLCGIQKAPLLQYQLLAMNSQNDVQTITAERNALLHTYKAIRGGAFHSTQLAHHLIAQNNVIENLFSRDDLMRILYVPSSITTTSADTLSLLTACGLFFAGNNS